MSDDVRRIILRRHVRLQVLMNDELLISETQYPIPDSQKVNA
jgi:hypothetical protein